MIERKILKELLEVAEEFPVITIIGPRQSGKTTLAKATFNDYEYCSLEDSDIREFAKSDPRGFFKKYSGKTIIDEIQRVPELLSYIQTIVDEEKINGKFIITGSHQLKLRAEISQSLSGRTAILRLLPLSISELSNNGVELDKESLLIKGFFPRLYSVKVDISRLLANYYETYIEKDIRQLINLKDVSQFQNFVKLLAGRIGQVINHSSLSNDIGVSSTTIKEWLSILEASFIIFKLPPYYENLGKRVIKSPKYYFTDVGLLCFLLGIENESQVIRDPLIGKIFENLVVIDLLKERYSQGKQANLYFFRDSNGNEVDIIYKKGRKLIPIEVKSSSTFNSSFIKGIKKFQTLTSFASKGYVVYSGDLVSDKESYSVINFKEICKIVHDEELD